MFVGTSVLQHVRLALNFMILTDHYRMRPCHDTVATIVMGTSLRGNISPQRASFLLTE